MLYCVPLLTIKLTQYYKDLEGVARSITNESKNWQEVDLNEHIHDEVETKVLHDICQRKSNNNRTPKNVRLFFKE